MILEEQLSFAISIFEILGFYFIAIWDKLSMGITLIEDVHIFFPVKFICDVFPLQTLRR